METEKTRLLQQEEDKKIQLAQLEESLLEVKSLSTEVSEKCVTVRKLVEQSAEHELKNALLLPIPCKMTIIYPINIFSQTVHSLNTE